MITNPRHIYHIKTTLCYKMTTQHEEWKKENTLTAPEDRNREVKFRLDQSSPPLTEEQVNKAIETLSVTSYVERFPQVERRFADPPIPQQTIGLISFVPAKGAKPNEKGIYGFAKLRGNFATDIEANEQAEKIIRTTDSYHKIFHTYVGRPFPLTLSSDYSKEVSDVQIKQEVKESFGDAVKKKREQEQREMEEIQAREKELLEDVKKSDDDDPADKYTTQMVKKAQLTWTYLETKKKLDQMVDLIARVRREVEEMDQKDPSLRTSYRDRYIEARKNANLPVDRDTTDQTFMRYLVEDVVLPEVDEAYRKLYQN